jgi:hypothetical protein
MDTRDLTGQYARWQMLLQEYDFKVIHRAGEKHQNADVLSRFPDPHTNDTETGTQLDPDVTTAMVRRPGLCLACVSAQSLGVPAQAVTAASHKQDLSFFDEFCPSFSSLLGPQSSFPDPAYYAYQVMQPSGDSEAHASSPKQKQKHKKKLHTAFPTPFNSEFGESGDNTQCHESLRTLARSCVMRSVMDTKKEIRKAVIERSKLFDCYEGTEAAINDWGPPLVMHKGPIAYEFFPRAAKHGVVLIELCAGICSGLEAVLLSGIPVVRYLYVDIDPLARRVAQFRVNNLVARFPDLLPHSAIQRTFSLPQDVKDVWWHHMEEACCLSKKATPAYLIMAGWPCQDYSPAGLGKLGKRAAVLDHVIHIIACVQEKHRYCTGYVLENICTQHNFNHPHIKHLVTEQLRLKLGNYVELDAAFAPQKRVSVLCHCQGTLQSYLRCKVGLLHNNRKVNSWLVTG